jgi:hypothetical protein
MEIMKLLVKYLNKQTIGKTAWIKLEKRGHNCLTNT